METYIEKSEVYPKREASQEELEANQEQIEAIVGQYRWVPHILPPCRKRLPVFCMESMKE
jgi:hypothetical protein